MKYSFGILLIILAVALAAYALWPRALTPPMTSYTTKTISAGAHTFEVEVADTESSRELGLGQRASLPQGRGMLFVFGSPGNWGFWMKDTEFPLDMLWARQDGTITTIARNVATSTYPQIFYPATPDALYVLEVNAGAAAGISLGDKIVVQ
jgi:uncharacterized membrane protein (UPF0127 family)